MYRSHQSAGPESRAGQGSKDKLRAGMDSKVKVMTRKRTPGAIGSKGEREGGKEGRDRLIPGSDRVILKTRREGGIYVLYVFSSHNEREFAL